MRFDKSLVAALSSAYEEPLWAPGGEELETQSPSHVSVLDVLLYKCPEEKHAGNQLRHKNGAYNHNVPCRRVRILRRKQEGLY
ncbi:hypothetical protein ACFX16_012136 [Malus domestica]